MYKKVIQSGNFLEIYEYEREPSPKRLIKKKHQNKNIVRLRTKRSVIRARETFYRTVRSTLKLGNPHFITLTFVNTKISVTDAYKALSAYHQRLKRHYSQYVSITVIEFRKSGDGLHFHSLTWGLPDQSAVQELTSRHLQSLWRRGWLDIRPTYAGGAIAGYMAKYMSKGMFDARLAGEKAYVTSRGALRSVRVVARSAVSYIEEDYGIQPTVDKPALQPIREKQYSTQWLGRCHYKAYENTVTSTQNYESDSNGEAGRDHSEEGRAQVGDFEWPF